MAANEHLELCDAFQKSFENLSAVCPVCGAVSLFLQLEKSEFRSWGRRTDPMAMTPLNSTCVKPPTKEEAVAALAEKMKYPRKLNQPLIEDWPWSRLHVGMCNACNNVMIGVTNEVCGKVIFPRNIPPDNAPPGVDSTIKKDYDEARKLLTISPMAAAVLARRCIQHVLHAKMGITKRTLFDEIV